MKKLPLLAGAPVLLYLFAIMPKIGGRQKAKFFSGRMYAHRGLHDNASRIPENSLAAFKRAVDEGFGIELDVQLTKDGVPVVFHDFTLARMARDCNGRPAKGKVCDYTYHALSKLTLLDSGEKIPTLAQVLEVVDAKVPLIVELKVEHFDLSVCGVTDSLLRKYKGAYCIESFHPLAVLWFRRHRPDIIRGQLSDAFHRDKPEEFKGPLYFVLTYLLFNFMTQPHFIAYNLRYRSNLSLLLCRRLYRAAAFAWTVRSEREFAEIQNAFDSFIFEGFRPDGHSRIQ